MSDSPLLSAACETHPGDDAAGDVVLRVQNLNYYYGEGELRKQVLFDNNLEVSRGEIVVMTGPSGSGKTTLLTLIGRPPQRSGGGVLRFSWQAVPRRVAQ